MDIMELGAIGELVGGVAVVVTLLYLAVQVRQGTAATRAGAQQTASANSTTLLLRAADPTIAELHHTGDSDYDSLSETARRQYDNHYLAAFNYWESMFYDHLHGALHEDMWDSRVRRMNHVFRRPGVRRVWRGHSALFGEAFESFVNEHVLISEKGA